MVDTAAISKYVCKLYGKPVITFGDIFLTGFVIIFFASIVASFFEVLFILGGVGLIAISLISHQSLFNITFISINPFKYSFFQFIGIEILGFIMLVILVSISLGLAAIANKVFDIKLLQCPYASENEKDEKDEKD